MKAINRIATFAWVLLAVFLTACSSDAPTKPSQSGGSTGSVDTTTGTTTNTRTGGVSDNVESQNSNVVGQAPSATPSLTGVAYTDTEVEIFWERATDIDGIVVGYDIIRDGELIKNSLDALSYYDNTVKPGMKHTYSVLSVDDKGNRSSDATISVLVPEAYATINRENYVEILRFVFEVLSTNLHRADRRLVRDAMSGFGAEQLIERNFNPETNLTTRKYSCANGGTYGLVASFGYETSQTGTFENCQRGTDVLDGTIESFQSGGAFQTVTYKNITITSVDGMTTTMSGNHKSTNYICRSDNYKSDISTDLNWNRQQFGGAVSLSDVNTRIGNGTDCGNPWRANLTGSFSARAPQTSNRPISVITNEDLLSRQPYDIRYSVGSILIRGERDGTSLRLNVGNGDADSEAIELISSDGTIESFNEPWASFVDILEPAVQRR